MKRFWTSATGLIFTIVLGILIGLVYGELKPYIKQPYANPDGTVTRQLVMPDGTSRSYRLHVPPEVPNNPPVLLALHGAGMTPWMMEVMTGLQLNELADEHGFVVAYPRAETLFWSVTDTPGNRDVEYINVLIDQLNKQFDGGVGPVHTSGISNGGMLSYQLLCQSSAVDGAVAVASYFPGFLESNCERAKSGSLLIMHGTADPLLPESDFGNTPDQQNHIQRTLNYFSTHRECTQPPARSPIIDTEAGDGTRFQHIYYNQCEGDPISYYRFIGGGHTWPGGQQIAPEALIGRTSREMNAGQVLVDFLGLSGRPP